MDLESKKCTFTAFLCSIDAIHLNLIYLCHFNYNLVIQFSYSLNRVEEMIYSAKRE